MTIALNYSRVKNDTDGANVIDEHNEIAFSGALLGAARARKKLTLTELSKLAGVSVAYLYQLEKNRTKSPMSKQLTKVCRALGISLDDLYVSQEKAEEQQHLAENRTTAQEALMTLEPDQLQEVLDLIEQLTKKKPRARNAAR